MTQFLDAFTRANSTGNTGLGTNYANITANSALAVVGNRAETTAGSTFWATLVAGVGPATNDQFAAVTVVNTLAANNGVAVRVKTRPTNVQQGYGYALTGNAATIKLARSYPEVGSTSLTLTGENGQLCEVPYTRAAGDRLAIAVAGDLIICWLNGAELFRARDSGIADGRPAIFSGAVAGQQFDDFAAGDYPADVAGVTGIPAPASTAPGALTGLTVTATGASTLAASWAATPTATTYRVRVKKTSDADTAYQTVGTVTGTSTTIGGRTAATGYTVEVTPINDAGTGTPATATATTSAAPTTPPNQVTGVTTNSLTPTSVTVAYTADVLADSYRVRHRSVGTATWTVDTTTATGSSYTVTGLDPSTPYEFDVTGRNSFGEGPASAVVTATTTDPGGTVVETTNAVRPSGLPAFRGLINNLAGERIIPALPVHRWHADFSGPPGAVTLPPWLTLSDGQASLIARGGGMLEIVTGAVAGAKAKLRMTDLIDTTQVSAILIEAQMMAFGAANPAADWRLFAAAGAAGASAVQLAAMPKIALTSQGELRRTPTIQSHLGQWAAGERPSGLLVMPITKEVFLLEDEGLIGYRDCSANWTDGLVQVGLSITTQTAAAARLRLSSLTITTYL